MMYRVHILFSNFKDLTLRSLITPSASQIFAKKNDILGLFEFLQLSESASCYQKSRCDCIEALCILLKIFSYPYRYKDMVPLFGSKLTELCLIFNETLHYVYQRHHHHKLESWNSIFLQPPYLQRYAASAGKYSPLYNCFGFVNGTVARICRPVLNERVVYDGHKSGLVVKHVGPWEGRKHDCVLCSMNRVY